MKEGYTFEGWYTSLNYKTEVTNKTKVSKPSNHKLYAKWKVNDYKVTFDSNGCETSSSISKTVTYGQIYGDLPSVSCTGYTFDGWYTSSLNGEKITNQSNVITASNHTLYAKWIPNSNTEYKVQHWKQNVDGTQEYNDINFTLNETDTLTGTTNEIITPSVKQYEGFTSPQAQTTTINPDGSRVINYYYTRNTYSITLTLGTGISEVSGDGIYKYGQLVTISATTKTGYTWSNWSNEITNKTHTFTMEAQNISLTASATPNKYTISYDCNGGVNLTQSSNHTYDVEENLTENSCSNQGYIFTGWKDSDENTFTDKQKVKNLTSMNNATILLIAQWAPIEYIISYNANGGSCTPKDISVKYNETTTLPSCTREGYTFISWLSPNGSNYPSGSIVSALSTTEGENVTLTAQWQANTYTVTLDANNATSSATTSIQATYDSEMPAITKPSRAYTVTFNANGGSVTSSSQTATYTFNGYYYNNTQYYTNTGASARTWNIASDTTLTANWTAKSITLPTPTRTMYTFNGWYTASSGGTKVGDGGSSYTPTKAITLYAQWTAKSPVTTTSGELAKFSYQSAYYPSCGLIQAIPHYTVTYHAEGYSTITIDTVKLYGGSWYYQSGISKNPSSSSIGATMYFNINATPVSGSVSSTVSKGNWITVDFNKSVTVSHTTAKTISIWWAMDDMTLGDVGMWYQGDSTEKVGTTSVTLNVP